MPRSATLHQGPGLERRHVVLAAATLLAVFVATASRGRVVNDVLSASLAAWRIATTGQPWFDDFPLAEIPTAPNQFLWTGEAGNGHVAVFRSPGAIAVGVPGYLLRQGGSAASDFAVWPGSVSAALLSVVTLLLFWLTLRTSLGDRPAGLAVLALGLSTPIWTVNADSLWTHSLTVVGIAGMAWSSSRERWWLVGLFGGVALWGRLHMALVVALLGLGLALWRRRPLIAMKAGSVSGIFLFMAAGWSRWMYGEWSPQGPYPTGVAYADAAAGRSLTDHFVNQLGLWVAPDRGLLVWTPVLVVLAPALTRSWRTLPDWSRLLAAAGVAYTLVQGTLNAFHGGSGFYGYRLTLELLACLFPAVAIATTRLTRRESALVAPILGLQLGAMSLGAVANGFFLPDEDSWTDNSLALALRTFPGVVLAWLCLCMLVTLLLARVVRGSRLRDVDVPSPGEP